MSGALGAVMAITVVLLVVAFHFWRKNRKYSFRNKNHAITIPPYEGNAIRGANLSQLRGCHMNFIMLTFSGEAAFESEKEERKEAEYEMPSKAAAYEMPREAAAYEIPVSSGTVSFMKTCS